MSETKQNGYSRHPARSFDDDSSLTDSAVLDAPTKQQAVAPTPNGNGKDVSSWDAYRNWLTKVQAPEQRRSLPDPALFSFKGYRSWAEKIRRDWDEDE
jgi:hypothetical protein